MAVKDQEKHFDDLSVSGDPVVAVPNTVSRHLQPGDRSFQQVVFQVNKPVTDADLNLAQDAAAFARRLLLSKQTPSGWLRGAGHHNALNDYGFDGVTPNVFTLPRLEAIVGGYPVVIEFTDTTTDDENVVTLDIPTIYDGTPTTVKRSDFVFLEVWLSLVAPATKASAVVTVVDSTSITAGDLVTIGGTPLTAVAGAPAVDEYTFVSGDDGTTATNMAAAINDGANSFSGTVAALAIGNTVVISAVANGTAGNGITLTVTNFIVGATTASGALGGGVDRINAPDQDNLYRHGNVLSPLGVALPDDLIDPTLSMESTQRVQVQYRIRATGAAEAVNRKAHPDGFSNPLGGGPPAAILAQGGYTGPVADYPFVPADGASTWFSSDASAYGIVDDGLWIAGDGTGTAAEDLGALDGFVYAIPIAFVFRRNDASDAGAAVQGFDPVLNTNGAPVFGHGGFAGVLGAIPAGLSDRPDGYFADIIEATDILDLRRHVSLTSFDLRSELQYQIQSLLDGSLRTWAIDTEDKQTLGTGSGDVSTQFLVCNEIGRRATEGGTAPPTGDSTGRGVAIRNFDHICRRFAGQPVVERVVFAFYPGDKPDLVTQGGPAAPGIENPGKYVIKAEDGGVPIDTLLWYENDVLHLDLDMWDATTLGGTFHGLTGGGISGVGLPSVFFTTFAPPGTTITDVLGMWHDDGDYTTPVDQTVKAKLIQGLGTPHLEITLDANDNSATGGIVAAAYRMVGSDVGGVITSDGSPRRIFVEVEITYPLGVGTTDTPDLEVDPDAVFYDGTIGAGPGPMIENDLTFRPSDLDVLLEPRFRSGFREIRLEYVTNDTQAHGPPSIGSPIGSIVTEEIVSRNTLDLYFPHRVYGDGGAYTAGITVTDVPAAAGVTVDTAVSEFGSSSRKVTLIPGTPLSGAGHTLAAIEYFGQDPIPNYGPSGAAGYQLSVYFRSNAPQTAGVKEGNILTTGDGVIPTTLHVEPLMVSANLWTGQVGMGSVDQAFPYGAPLDQIPTNDGPAPSTMEWYFTATASTTVDDFNADTGLMALHSFVQIDGQDILELGGVGGDEPPRKDAEFRAYYPFSDDDAYRPTAMSQPLSGAVRHKVFAPVLCRATEDVPGVTGGLLYRKNELLLVVFSRFAELDEENTVRFIDPKADNRTGAGVYRTRNMLLVVGDS